MNGVASKFFGRYGLEKASAAHNTVRAYSISQRPPRGQKGHAYE